MIDAVAAGLPACRRAWRSTGGLERAKIQPGTNSFRVFDEIPCRIPAVGDVILLNMSDTDLELLARYTRHHAEDAFAELVRRHLALVHSAALRQVRSPQLAEEVAQSTFLKLARQAQQLAPDTILTAWLYQVARRESIDVVRREARRQLREQIATEMNAMNATAADWTHIEPLLDEAMHALDDTDRTAVLLRYFENKSLRKVGAALGTSDDTAQKRVSRAVERLREFFAQHGVNVGASGLVVVISANAVQAAPVGLAATLTTASLASAAVGTGTTLTLLKFMAMTKLKLTVAAALLAVVLTPVIVWQVNGYRLRNVVAATPQVRQNPAAAPADDQWNKMFQVMYGLGRPAKDARLEQLKLLIDQGVDVNMAIGFDRMALEGETRADLRPTNWPLDVAAQQGRLDMVKLLLANGAKVHGKELPKAAFAQNQDESFAMITALIQAGADVNARDGSFTALHWASFRGNTNSVKLLLAQLGIKLDGTDSDGRTALMAAADHGHTEIVEMLLKAGANVSITSKRGETAATLAQMRLEKQQAELQKQQAIISKLQFPPK